MTIHCWPRLKVLENPNPHTPKVLCAKPQAQWTWNTKRGIDPATLIWYYDCAIATAHCTAHCKLTKFLFDQVVRIARSLQSQRWCNFSRCNTKVWSHLTLNTCCRTQERRSWIKIICIGYLSSLVHIIKSQFSSTLSFRSSLELLTRPNETYVCSEVSGLKSRWLHDDSDDSWLIDWLVDWLSVSINIKFKVKE